jgi:hypothetical protein
MNRNKSVDATARSPVVSSESPAPTRHFERSEPIHILTKDRRWMMGLAVMLLPFLALLLDHSVVNRQST